MNNLESYYLALVVTQLLHSQEEIWTRFENKWPLWKMSRKFFICFEVLFSILIISLYLFKNFPQRELSMLIFNVLMFANGIWHLMWAGIKKQYITGLITAQIFIIVY